MIQLKREVDRYLGGGSEYAEWSKNRYNNEISKTGIYSFFAELRNNKLDFKTFYNSISDEEAFQLIRNNLKDLSKMQTLVARDLEMERGKCSSIVEAQRIGVEVQQSRKRLNIKEYKVQKRKENELKKEVQELKKEIYNFKEMQKTITALELTSDEKKELHRLNSQVKNQNATIEDLNKKLSKKNDELDKAKSQKKPDNKKIKEITGERDKIKGELESVHSDFRKDLSKNKLSDF